MEFKIWFSRQRLCLAVLLLGFLPGLAQAASAAPLTLAVHPYLPVPEIHKRFTPLAEYLSKVMEQPVRVRVGGDYDEHIKAIGTNHVDIAFLGPVSYLRMVDQYGPKPLLARFQVGGQAELYGVLAVRQDSPLKELAELANKRFAFGDPESTMSHLIPRYMLLQAGIPKGLPDNHQFLGSHKNVAIGVLVGDFDAGAMKKEVFDEFAPKGLKALAMTPGVPDHVFVARSDLPPETVAKLRKALLHLGRRPMGADILGRLHRGLSDLIPTQDQDFDALRDMVKKVDAQNP